MPVRMGVEVVRVLRLEEEEEEEEGEEGWGEGWMMRRRGRRFCMRRG